MAEANKLYSFTLPSPYQAELAKIADQQRMAEMLQAQSQAPIERYGYKGIEARTPATAGLAKLLQGFGGAYFQGQAREQEKALGEKYRAQSAGEVKDFLSALRGTPAIAEKEMPESNFMPSGSDLTDLTPPQRVPEGQLGEGNVVQPAYKTPAVPGVPADRGRALGLAMQSINPMLQSAGGALLAAEMPKATKWEKAELPDVGGAIKTGWVDINAPDPSKTFISGGTKPAEVTYVDVGSGTQPTNKATGLPLPNAPVIPKSVSTDTQARLAQDKFLSDRAFTNLSAAQQETQKAEAKRFGLSIQEYNLKKWQADNPSLSFQETETGPMAFNPKTGVAAPVTTPAGTPLPGSKPLTESQGKATGFASRAIEADQILKNIGKDGEVKPSLLKAGVEGIPLIGGGLGAAVNVLVPSGPQQQVEQAQRNFINALLRQESGAAIAESEFANAQKQYFPQAGDSPEVIKQKAANRQTSINALKVQAGPGMQRMPQQAATTAPMRAKNAQTGAEIVSTDGGVTWQPAGR